MYKSKIKLYSGLIFFTSLILMFITWQQVTKFRLGYKITRVKDFIRNEEIKNQEIMREYRVYGGVEYVDRRAQEEYKMELPDPAICEILGVEGRMIFQKKSKDIKTFVSDIKEIFLPRNAEAR